MGPSYKEIAMAQFEGPWPLMNQLGVGCRGFPFVLKELGHILNGELA